MAEEITTTQPALISSEQITSELHPTVLRRSRSTRVRFERTLLLAGFFVLPSVKQDADVLVPGQVEYVKLVFGIALWRLTYE